MKNRLFACGFFALIAAAVAACTGYEHTSSPTSPSSAGVSALMGTWASATVAPSASSCTDFKWTVTERTSTTAKGSFSATCLNNLVVAGTAEASLNGSTIAWSAAGNATGPSVPSPCAITLTGTAELGTDSIRVPYSGNTCLGNVSGVEILKKR